jgi:hypothetical protein
MNGHKKDQYKKMEVIADEIFFSGDAQEVDKFINEQLQTPPK